MCGRSADGTLSIGVVRLLRIVIVFDAADLNAENARSGPGARVPAYEAWHSVIDATGVWRIGLRLDRIMYLWIRRELVTPAGDRYRSSEVAGQR